MLGCPACGGEWEVTDGIAHFGPRAELQASAVPDATTLAAFLGLTDPQVVVTDGVPANVVESLVREFFEDEGVSERLYLSTVRFIGWAVNSQAAEHFVKHVDATDGRFYVKGGEDEFQQLIREMFAG